MLYARRPGAFGPEETRRADKFARHASGALALSLRMASCADQNDQLRSSIVSRAVIDQALGVIMATERCPQDKAFALLRSVSQNTNVKIRDLAATIVTRVSGEPPQAHGPVRGRVRLMNTRMRGWQASDGRLPLSTPHWLAERAFRQGDIPAVRRFTQAFGARTGIGSARLADFVLAVSEAAACATAVGPCTARVRLWVTGTRAFCEVRGDGMLLRRSARGARPGGRPGEEEALRRWVLRQLSDYVSSRPARTGCGCCCRCGSPDRGTHRE